MARMERGNYFGRLLSTGVAQLNNDKQTPYLYLTFLITLRAENGKWIELPDGITRDMLVYLSDRAWEFSQDKLRSIGFNGNFETPVFKDELYRQGMELVCDHRTDRNDPSKIYEDWEPAEWKKNEREHTPMPGDLIGQLSAKWRIGEQAAKAPAGAPPPPAPRGAATPAGAGAVSGRAVNAGDDAPAGGPTNVVEDLPF